MFEGDWGKLFQNKTFNRENLIQNIRNQEIVNKISFDICFYINFEY